MNSIWKQEMCKPGIPRSRTKVEVKLVNNCGMCCLIYLCVCVCVCEGACHICHCMHVKVRGHCLAVRSLLPLCRS